MAEALKPKFPFKPLFLITGVASAYFLGTGTAEAHDGLQPEHFSDTNHADLIAADQDLNAPDVDPNKVQDFIRFGTSVDKALADVNKLIAAYSEVSGPNDAPLRVLTEYRDMFVAAQHDIALATHRVDELQHQFSAYHTTTSALRMAHEIHIPNPTEFNNTYSQLAQFYDNLSPGEFVLAKSDVVAKDWISSHVPFKDVGPAPQDPIEYLGHIPDKAAHIPPRLGFQIDRMVHSLPPELQDLKVTAGNAEAPKDAVHLENSCHYRTPLRCVDMAALSPTDDPNINGTRLARINSFAEVDHANFEIKDKEKFDRLHSEYIRLLGSDGASHVVYNPNATNDHIHIVFK